jgi:tRNA nucleotidyltransferase/poly(A) polymerase
MRPSEASARVVLLAVALDSIKEKGGNHLGPKIGRNANSIGAAAARSIGLVVDSNDRLRCPPTSGDEAGEFTDAQGSNCALGAVEDVARNTIRKLADLPSSMRKLRNLKARYRPTRKTKKGPDTPSGGPDANAYWADRLNDGMPLDAVPDEFLWAGIVTSMDSGNDRFEMIRLDEVDSVVDQSGNEIESGINQVAMITDKETGQQMFVKGDMEAHEAPASEILSHLVANALGLPVGEFRIANDGENHEELLTLQTHVGGYVNGDLFKPHQDADSVFDAESTFGTPQAFDVDNLSTTMLFDWVVGNGDRHAGNMFLTRDSAGRVHVVPIDHGFTLDPAKDDPAGARDLLMWATHDDRKGMLSAGFAFVLVDQELNGFATRDEILDGLESARERIGNLGVDDLDSEMQDMLPDNYRMDDFSQKREMLRRRIDDISGISRKDFSNMLDRIQSGESTKAGYALLGTDVAYYKPGVVVPDDASVHGMEDWQHGIRQPNGLLVRGNPLSYNDLEHSKVYNIASIDEDVRSGGTLKPDTDGLHVGYVGLAESEEDANRILEDMNFYRDLSQAWKDDDFDAAFGMLEREADRLGLDGVGTEEKMREHWDRQKPLVFANLYFMARAGTTGEPIPELSHRHDDFVAAADAPRPGIVEVRAEDLKGGMLTRTPKGLRFHGDVKHRRIRRNPFKKDKTTPEGVAAVPERRALDLKTPDDLVPIHDVFKENDKKLLLVGGAVRDTLLGREPKDFDLATDATSDEVMDMLRNSDPTLNIELTGEDFPVVRVKTTDGIEYEIATFRRDVGEGADATSVAGTIDDDVVRRDLTINAMYYDLDSREVIDYVGGMDDIDNGVVRAVGKPADRFREDKLRILRALRFSGRTGFDLDEETKEAILEDNDLSLVSNERIHDEFLSGLKSAKDPEAFLKLVEDMGMFPQIFRTDSDDELTVDIDNVANSGNPSVMIASILNSNDAADVESVLKSMKYTNDEISDVMFLQRLANIDAESAPALKKALRNRDLDTDDLEAFAESVGMSKAQLESFVEFADAPPAMSSAAAIAQGLEGPEIGRALQEAERAAYQLRRDELTRVDSLGNATRENDKFSEYDVSETAYSGDFKDVLGDSFTKLEVTKSEGQSNHSVAVSADVSGNGESQEIGLIVWNQESGKIELITVVPEFQRRGLGSALHRAAEQIAKDNGMTLPAQSNNLTEEGRALREALGILQ